MDAIYWTALCSISAVDCAHLQTQGVHTSGVYTFASKDQTYEVYCDLETAGGGWTVIY